MPREAHSQELDGAPELLQGEGEGEEAKEGEEGKKNERKEEGNYGKNYLQKVLESDSISQRLESAGD